MPTAVLVPNRPGDKGYQQLEPQDLEGFNIDENLELDDDLLPERLKKPRTKAEKAEKKKRAQRGKFANLFDAEAAQAEAEAEAEAAAKGVRPQPMYREVVWNEYCVLFPDGSHTPFNDEVRYTNLRGYLRKRRVVSDGGTEYALQYGAQRRGWHRHYMYINLKLLAWFETDPEAAKGPTTLESIKLALSRSKGSKGLGSVHLDQQDCHLYIHRQYPNEFAVRFDQHLLQLQAATPEDARAWVVTIASCLYFCSSAFAELIEDCGRFFSAVPKSYDDNRLSVMEALDLLRAMGREHATLEQVEACAELTATADRRFDAREFAFLVRYVCSEVEPSMELLRAFEVFDPRGHNAVSADALVTHLVDSGVPPEEIESIIRAAGPTKHGNIHYVRLVRAIYPNSGADVDDGLRDTGSTRASAVSERTSQVLAEAQKRASEAKERQLRASEAAELQSHRQSLALQRAESTDSAGDIRSSLTSTAAVAAGNRSSAAAAAAAAARLGPAASLAAAVSAENTGRGNAEQPGYAQCATASTDAATDQLHRI